MCKSHKNLSPTLISTVDRFKRSIMNTMSAFDLFFYYYFAVQTALIGRAIENGPNRKYFRNFAPNKGCY